MTKAIYEDLEPVSDLIIRCEICGTPFVEEHHLNNHIAENHPVPIVDIDGVRQKVATEFES